MYMIDELIEKYTRRKNFVYKNWRENFHKMFDEDRSYQRSVIEDLIGFIKDLELLKNEQQNQ